MSDSSNFNASQSHMGRRAFLKMAAMAGVGAAGAAVASETVKHVNAEATNPYPDSQKIKTVCTSCSVGCGIIAEVKNGVWVRQEVAQDHPISSGGHCCKGASMIDMVRSERRLKYPMVKRDGKWQRISWQQALDEIADKMKKITAKNGPDATAFMGSAKMSNEQSYYFRKFAAFYGTNNIDHQARICHSSTVAGVANTFGYGAQTNHIGDMQHSKAIFVIGANPAVAHPVAMQHILKAKENGAKIMVVEPRYSRTAAKSDLYIRIRSGTDIPFMYGMINFLVAHNLHDQKFLDDRVFDWEMALAESKQYTPEVVADICGCNVGDVEKAARFMAANRPGTLIWAMGLTQHTIGSSNTRIAPILQMFLGNIGKSGGGTNILRGHDNVQGASDYGCQSETLPGYYGLAEGSWKHFANVWKVDFDWLKARFKTTKEKVKEKQIIDGVEKEVEVIKDVNWMADKNGFTLARWWAGVTEEEKIYNAGTNLKALFVMGCGIVSTAQTHKVKSGLDKLELLVLADPFVNEAAVLTDKENDVYILPSATQFETEGGVTATNRSVQYRFKVVDPIYEAKEDHWVMFEMAKRLGFYKEYTRSLGDGNGHFSWPQDATKEINAGIRSIGCNGILSERIKEHTRNWHEFDMVTLRRKPEYIAKGKPADYYGLPWPCWTPTHPGTPNLYNTDLAVKDGGMGFRAGWADKNAEGKMVTVAEKNGKSVIAADGSAPVDSSVHGGYLEITDEVLEKLGVHLSVEEKAIVKGKNFKTDTSDILATKAVAAGLCPCGNGKARANVWNFPDAVPKHREPLHSIRPDLTAKYPAYPDKKNFFRVDTQYIGKQKGKDYTKEFPLTLTTGRLVTHNGAGMETRSSKYLAEVDGVMFVDINPKTAEKLGIKNTDDVWVYSPDGGKGKMKARYSHAVDEKTVFMPFHFFGVFQGKSLYDNYPEGNAPYALGESCNSITNYGYDIITQIPETKTGLCRIEKA